MNKLVRINLQDRLIGKISKQKFAVQTKSEDDSSDVEFLTLDQIKESYGHEKVNEFAR